jgi:uncharacterized protein YndB with AHSA1/START domain
VIQPLEISFEVAAPVEHAFDTWTRRIDTWWPTDHTASGDADASIILEPHLGGRLYERTSGGVEHDWGRVIEWQPPSRFAYTWHLRRDAADATDVQINFTSLDGSRTRVDILHTGWERLGEGGQDWRDRNHGGWDSLLPHFLSAVEGSP